MRFFILLTALLCTPLMAHAQNRSAAPLMAVGSGAPIVATPVDPEPTQAAEPFPDNAVTSVSRDAHGRQLNRPAPAQRAAQPDPVSPEKPVSEVWPYNTVPLFMQTCMQFHAELAPPCKCIITNVMKQMKHDEFLRLSSTGEMEKDPRILAINRQCSADAPKRE